MDTRPHLRPIPASFVSLTGERALRMRVDPAADQPLSAPVPVAAGEARPFATIDLESLRANRQVGVAPS